MNQEEVLGRNPLETERDSIWNKPQPTRSGPSAGVPEPPKAPPLDNGISKVVITDDAPPVPPPVAQAAGSIKEGPPLVSSALPPAQAVAASAVEASPQRAAPPPSSPVAEAVKDEKENIIEETEQLVGFKIGKECFGIEIINIQEIIRFQEITMVPRTPEFVEGVISLRGRVIPVINLRKRFNMEGYEKTKDTRIIIVELDCGTVGFIVDAVTEVTSIPRQSIDPAPSTATGVSREYIRGVGKLADKLMVILNLNLVLSKESKSQIKQMAA